MEPELVAVQVLVIPTVDDRLSNRLVGAKGPVQDRSRFTFFSFIRTKALPLPGFTCWYSTIWKIPSSRSRAIPGLTSLVEIMT